MTKTGVRLSDPPKKTRETDSPLIPLSISNPHLTELQGEFTKQTTLTTPSSGFPKSNGQIPIPSLNPNLPGYYELIARTFGSTGPSSSRISEDLSTKKFQKNN
jgi:hypothetical protein